jgi:hypothetical protein
MRDLAYVSATTRCLVHVSDSPALAHGLGLMKTTNAGKTRSAASPLTGRRTAKSKKDLKTD